MNILRLLLFFACSLPTMALAQWTNEPAGSQVLVDCTMSSPTCGGLVTDVYPGSQQAGNTSDPISAGSSTMVRLPYSGPCGGNVGQFYSCAQGGGHLYYATASATKALYVGVTFLIPAGINCSLASSTKIFFNRNYERNFGFNILNGFFGFGGCGATKQMFWGHNTGGLNNDHVCATDSGLRCDSNVGPGTFQAGTWVKFESCTQSSTSSTARNATVKWWVNGAPAGAYTTLNYGNGNVGEWVWNQTWDGYGNGQGFTSENQQHLGHLRISIPPGQTCGASTGPVDVPAGAPGTVTGVTATVSGVQ